MYDIELGEFYGWTYEKRPSLTHEELSAKYPEAMCLFDWSCPGLASSAQIRFVEAKGTLRVSRAWRGFSNDQSPSWDPNLKLWRRYSIGVSSRPRRELHTSVKSFPNGALLIREHG